MLQEGMSRQIQYVCFRSQYRIGPIVYVNIFGLVPEPAQPLNRQQIVERTQKPEMDLKLCYV